MSEDRYRCQTEQERGTVLLSHGDNQPPDLYRFVRGESPDGVVGARIAAALIDGVPLLFLLFGVANQFGDLGGSHRVTIGLFGAPFDVYLVSAIAYFVIPEAVWGTSPGKRVMGLVVTSVGGEPVSWEQSLVRNLLRLVDWFPALYMIGMLSIAVSRRDQRLGDRVSNTVVKSWLTTAAGDAPEERPQSHEGPALFALAAATCLVGIGLLVLT
jgi:uncharacterized RDD family membrane protein YckC